MLIRTYWPSCDYWSQRSGGPVIDGFWVECTAQEARYDVLPMLEPRQLKDSERFAGEGMRMAESLGDPARPYCFLVARDSSHVTPLQVHYPFANLWNGYSPFRAIAPRHVQKLAELAGIVVEELGPKN